METCGRDCTHHSGIWSAGASILLDLLRRSEISILASQAVQAVARVRLSFSGRAKADMMLQIQRSCCGWLLLRHALLQHAGHLAPPGFVTIRSRQ